MSTSNLVINDRRRVRMDGTESPVVTSPLGISESQPEVMGAYGSFQGAEFSRDRGYVYLPTLNTLREVDSYSHRELMKRARFAYNSGGGLVQRAIDGVARMICGTGLFPYPLSPNKAINNKVRRLWMSRAESKNTFDLSRKFSCGMAQQAIMRSQIRDGDLAPVLARNEDGRLRVMFYEGHQIGCGTSASNAREGWHHGVKLDRHNAPIAYRISSQPVNGQETSVDVPAQNVLFCADYQRFGQVRGLSRLYPVINKLLDRGEIMHALTKGIKMRAQVGWAIEQQLENNKVSAVPGAPGGSLPNFRPQAMVETPSGDRITLEKFFGGGESFELKPGQSFKTVESDHPSDNVREHLENLQRDVAWGMRYSPELLWNITQLGGANTRFIMADAQSQIETEQQMLVEQFLGPYYIAWIRDMIEAGELEDFDGWELHTWLTPKRLTVDFGRDGKLHIEQAKRGHITLKSLYGYVGEEWQIEIDQYLDERQYIKDGLTAGGRTLTWAEAFPEITSPDKVQPGAEAGQAGNTAAADDKMRQQIDDIHEALARAEEKPFVRL